MTELGDLDWSEKMKLKNQLSEDNTVQCEIEKATINESTSTAIINFKTDVCNISDKIELDATFKLDGESEFESFLKSYGYAPAEDNIFEKLTDIKIELKLVKNSSGELLFKHNDRKHCNINTQNQKTNDQNQNEDDNTNRSPFLTDTNKSRPGTRPVNYRE